MGALERVIGYESVKRELLQRLDQLKNPEVYERLGAAEAGGILLRGKPGVGKTLMAMAFLHDCGLPHFSVRPERTGESLAEHLREVFRKAKEAAPSVILLDDMDKFSANDKDCSGFHAVQACMDEVAEQGVCVIATVNDMDALPDSLCREGRFDTVLTMHAPVGRDATEIILYYMQDKPFVGDFLADDIFGMLYGKTCAALETILNKAAAFAAYERQESVGIEQIVRAYLNEVADEDAKESSEPVREEAAWHEAGHAAMLEILCPGSVGFAACTAKSHFVERCRPCLPQEQENLVAVAGKAAAELHFGGRARGTRQDLTRMYGKTYSHLYEEAIRGFAFMGAPREDSPALHLMKEAVTAAEMDRCEQRAKTILAQNRALVEEIAAALQKQGYLLRSQMQAVCAAHEISLPTIV